MANPEFPQTFKGTTLVKVLDAEVIVVTDQHLLIIQPSGAKSAVDPENLALRHMAACSGLGGGRVVAEVKRDDAKI